MKIKFGIIFALIIMGNCRYRESHSVQLYKKASEILTRNPTNNDSLRDVLNLLDSAIQFDTNNAKYLYTKCKVAITLKNYDTAIKCCNIVLAKYQDNYIVTLTKGVVFDLSNRRDSAMQTYARALKLLNKTIFEKQMYQEDDRITLFGLLNDTVKFNLGLKEFKARFKNEPQFNGFYQNLVQFNRVKYINSYSY